MTCKLDVSPGFFVCIIAAHTDPIARKKEKVAALLSIYCDSVARNPRGPAPPLVEEFNRSEDLLEQ